MEKQPPESIQQPPESIQLLQLMIITGMVVDLATETKLYRSSVLLGRLIECATIFMCNPKTGNSTQGGGEQ